jgi:DNA-binding MarR family transcriptional regulator
MDGAIDRATALEAVRALARASSVLERSSPELSLAHYRVLSAIAAGEERASNIARSLAVGRPAISAAVESLCQRGLLERSQVEGDSRAVSLHLTGPGQRLLDVVESEMLARLDDLRGRTPDGDRLLESLLWLGRAVDARRAERWALREGEPSPAGGGCR